MNYKDYLPLVDSIHYQRYIRFIEQRLTRKLKAESLVERHHIVPRSFGRAGDFKTEPWNIVALSPREHFIAHLILWKLYAGKMAVAFLYVSKGRELTARQYQSLQEDIVAHKKKQIISEQQKEAIRKSQLGKPKTPESIAKRLKTLSLNPYTCTAEIGDKISQELSGRIRVHKEQEEKSIKSSELDNYLQNGWIRGRKSKPHAIPSQKGRRRIRKAGVEKNIPPEELAKYEADGWELGRA